MRPLPKVTHHPKPAATEATVQRPVTPIQRLAQIPAPRALRILDFDIENRPLNYGGGDGFTWPDITVIAWQWWGEPGQPAAWLQLPPPDGRKSRLDMLRAFVAVYDEADMVTGHNVRMHDLPNISGALVEHGMPPLGEKLVHDTYADLKRFRGISRSQENLARVLGVRSPKIDMPQELWRSANRLEGIEYAYERCVGDVIQHLELRARLMEEDLLRAPRRWNAGSTRRVEVHA